MFESERHRLDELTAIALRLVRQADDERRRQVALIEQLNIQREERRFR